eukprot:jgi/Galph1/2875/GphlegSOOS_G1539.1
MKGHCNVVYGLSLGFLALNLNRQVPCRKLWSPRKDPPICRLSSFLYLSPCRRTDYNTNRRNHTCHKLFLKAELSDSTREPSPQKRPNIFIEFIRHVHWPLLFYVPPLYYFLNRLLVDVMILPHQRVNSATLAIFLCELFRCLLQDMKALGVSIGKKLQWLRKERELKSIDGKRTQKRLRKSAPLCDLHRHLYLLLCTAVLEIVGFYTAMVVSDRLGLVLVVCSQLFFNALSNWTISETGECERVSPKMKLVMLFGDALYLGFCLLYFFGLFPLSLSIMCLLLLLSYLVLKYLVIPGQMKNNME